MTPTKTGKRHHLIRQARRYRGNLHGHSTHSDGQNTPQEVIHLYRDAGYDFTCLSDHYGANQRFCATSIIDATDLDSADFVTIPSAELHCPGKAHDRDGLFHILANGLPPDFHMAAAGETAADLVRRAVTAGAYVTIAHPEWYNLTEAEAEMLAKAGAHGVEVYNHSCAVETARGGGTATIDLLHHCGHRLHLSATDDSHVIPNDAFGGWVMVAATALDAPSLLAALHAGDFYASTGPDFSEVTYQDGVVDVTCSPVARIIIAASGHHSMQAYAGDGMPGLTSASFDLTGMAPDFFRIALIDNAGQSAWSNAFWPMGAE